MNEEELHLLSCPKVAADHNLVPKFLYPAILSTDKRIFLPCPAMEARVNLKASAPYASNPSGYCLRVALAIFGAESGFLSPRVRFAY